jgi:hypothetical protein
MFPGFLRTLCVTLLFLTPTLALASLPAVDPPVRYMSPIPPYPAQAVATY